MYRMLQEEIERLETQLKDKKDTLSRIQNDCQHDWGQIGYDPINHEAYHILSDIERGVYLGVDTIVSGIDLPAETIKQWKRTCLLCGKTEITRKIKTIYDSGGIPGCSASKEVPDFGDKR